MYSSPMGIPSCKCLDLCVVNPCMHASTAEFPYAKLRYIIGENFPGYVLEKLRTGAGQVQKEYRYSALYFE